MTWVPHDRPAARIQASMEREKNRREETMLRALEEAVNAERTKIGKGPVSRDDIVRADSAACGHSDYSRKVALYGEELVLGE